MAKRTAARIVTEYTNKQRTPEYIRALAVAIGRQDVLDLLRKLEEGTVASAWVACKKCGVLVPFGDEKFRAGKHYCATCYRKEFSRAKEIDEEEGDEVSASGAEGTELQEVPEPVAQEADDTAVPAPRSEDDPDSGSGTADQGAGSSVDAVCEAVPETPRRMKWW